MSYKSKFKRGDSVEVIACNNAGAHEVGQIGTVRGSKLSANSGLPIVSIRVQHTGTWWSHETDVILHTTKRFEIKK